METFIIILIHILGFLYITGFSILAEKGKVSGFLIVGALGMNRFFVNIYMMILFTVLGIMTYVLPTGAENIWFFVGAGQILIMLLIDRLYTNQFRKPSKKIPWWYW